MRSASDQDVVTNEEIHILDKGTKEETMDKEDANTICMVETDTDEQQIEMVETHHALVVSDQDPVQDTSLLTMVHQWMCILRYNTHLKYGLTCLTLIDNS